MKNNILKKTSLIFLLLLLSIANASSNTISSNLIGFNVQTNSSGKVYVSNTSQTTVPAIVGLTRGFGSYVPGQYDPVAFEYTIVYEKNGVETILKSLVTITQDNFSSDQSSLNIPISLIIPAGASGGFIKIKHRSYIWYANTPNFNTWNPSTGYAVQTGPQTEATIIAPPGGPAGSYPVYAYRDNSYWAQRFRVIAPGATPPPYYTWTITFAKFRVYPTYQPGTVPVHEWVWYLSKRPENRDYYYSTNAYAIHVPDYGWKEFYGDQFYAYSTQVAGTVPVHRYYDLGTSKYYMTADPAEISYLNSKPTIYRKEGIAFYAFPE